MSREMSIPLMQRVISKAVSSAVQLSVAGLRARVFRHVNMEAIMTNNSPRLLDIPQAFFPTKVTDRDEVLAFAPRRFHLSRNQKPVALMSTGLSCCVTRCFPETSMEHGFG